MVAILGGSLAALSWGFAALAASRATSALGSRIVLAWVMLVGLCLAVPITLSQPIPALDVEAWALLALSGLGNVLGLLVAYTALSTGKVSIVAPITSTEGAGAAAIAIVLGEAVAVPVLVALGVAALGVVLVSWERGRARGEAVAPEAGAAPSPALPVGEPVVVAVPEPADADPTGEPRRDHGRAAGLAILSAVLFAVGLYATGRVGAELSVGLTILPSRMLGVLFVTIPLALGGRLGLSRRTFPLVLAMGCLEVIGVVGIALGARDAIAITVVISSQFAAVAVVGAFLVFQERIERHQVLGIGLILAGVASVALLRAAG